MGTTLEIFARAEKHIQIKVYPSIARHYSSVEVLVLDEAPEKWLTVVDDGVDKKKILLAHLSKYQVNDLFHEVKDVLYFEEKSFCLIKANYYKNWHPAIARLDLMELTDQILSRNAKGEK